MASALRSLGDLLWAPFSALPPLAAVLSCAVILGLLLLLAFRLLSPQRRLQRVKEEMSACLYEMRIFAAYPGRVLAAQGRALILTLVYLLLASPALVVLGSPVVAMLSRASTELDYRPLVAGEVAHVTIDLARAVERGALRVEPATPDLEVLPPLVLVRSTGTAYVRVRARRPGAQRLRIRVGSGPGQAVIDKEVSVGSGPVSPSRSLAGSLSLLLSREAPLPPDGPVSKIMLAYPARELSWLGLPWYALLLVVSLIAAFAARRRLGVVI